MQQTRSALGFDRGKALAFGGVILVALLASVVNPQNFSSAVFGLIGLACIAVRPDWGVGLLLAMLMMQYRNQYLWISQVLPSGSGLFTINNVLGLILAVVMGYRLYQDGDWSFLRNRQLRLILLITVAIVASATLNPIDYGELLALGIRPPNQDPVRLMISRALFLLLFVFFVRGPREIRVAVGIFVGLSAVTAWAASSAAISGAGWAGGVGARVEEGYRAGGGAVITRVAGNPNRLAMIATLMVIMVWEYSQSPRGRRWMVLTTGMILGLVVTVFLTASRGGMIGLAFSTLLLLARRRASARRLVTAAAVALIGYALIGQVVPEQSLERLTNIPGLGGTDSESGTGSVLRRQYTLGIALGLSMEHPLLGIGIGNWEKERFLRDPVHSTTVPHNSYMLALVEGGLIALILYAALFIVTLRELGAIERDEAAMQRAHAEGMGWLVSATRLCLVSLLMFSLFSDLWETINLYFLVSVAAVLILRYGHSEPEPQPV